jgi:hypothetical protein
VFSHGRACDTDGANVVVTYHGVPDTAQIRVYFPGDHLTGGMSPDSQGSGTAGYVFRSQRCTGTELDGFAVTVMDAHGKAVMSRRFTVSN